MDVMISWLGLTYFTKATVSDEFTYRLDLGMVGPVFGDGHYSMCLLCSHHNIPRILQIRSYKKTGVRRENPTRKLTNGLFKNDMFFSSNRRLNKLWMAQFRKRYI
jgi:hypothetical protein